MAAKKKYDEKRMPFLEHLEELRWNIFRSFISMFVLSIIFYFFSEELLDFLTSPYPGTLITLGPTDPFMIRVKVAFFAALVVSIPVIVREIWSFIAPGLLEQERKHVPMLIFLTSLCFLIGASFAFFIVLPLTIKFLLSFQTEKIQANTTINLYLQFVTRTLLGFGAVFELPMLSMVLTRIGIVTPELMKKYRSYAIVAIFVVAAVITPSTDATTQLLLAGPMMVLYEISILLSRMIAKRKKLQEEQEEREYEDELKQESKRRIAQKKEALAAEAKKDTAQEELKKWETEGEHYEEPETSAPDTKGYTDDTMYPYDMDSYNEPYSKNISEAKLGEDKSRDDTLPYDITPMDDYYDAAMNQDQDGDVSNNGIIKNSSAPESLSQDKKDTDTDNKNI